MSAGGPDWLLTMWIAFMAVVAAGVIAVFVWAVRARQFRDQERARFLALHSGIPEEEKQLKVKNEKLKI